MKTRVRFAPSPTGPLHIGGLRTALFNYLHAKKNSGSFVLRVEDTDQNRYVGGSEEYIQRALEWCGMIPDEGPKIGGNYGPYRQSDRKTIYKKYITVLLEKGLAYYAFDDEKSLKIARSEAEKIGKNFQYCAKNRMSFKNSLSLDESEKKKALKGNYIVRLKVPSGKKITVFDEIRGNISVETDLLDDKVLMKSDGMPTYHFANVIDDRLMEISTVIRGEEWLPSLPTHKLIYDAFGWETPKFMHLPLILKPNGKGKLSKRDGDKGGFPIFPLGWKETEGFREGGFLPESVINYLALLGWNDGTEKEIFDLSDLKKVFSLKGIQKGGARFDYEKARWLNHKYITKTASDILIKEKVIKDELSRYPKEKHKIIISLVKDRLYTLKDIKKEVAFLNEPKTFDDKVIAKLKKKNPLLVLDAIYSLIKENREGHNIKEDLFEWAKINEIPLNLVMQSFRMSIIGRLTGPDLFAVCSVLGKDVTLKRVSNLINHLKYK